MKDSFPARLKALRLSRKLTQRKLADETGLSLSAIISYENGLREPNYKSMGILESYFGVSGEYLRGKKELSNADSLKEPSKYLLELNTVIKDYDLLSSERTEIEQNITSDLIATYIDHINGLLLISHDSENKCRVMKQMKLEKKFLVSMIELSGKLNSDGQNVLIERGNELCEIEKYKNHI